MSRPYFMLFVREDGVWVPEFGDYERQIVVDEMEDYHHGYRNVKKKDMKVMRLASGKRLVVDAVQAALNSEKK
jgi:hypothetical protein